MLIKTKWGRKITWGKTIQTVYISKSDKSQQTAHSNLPTNKNIPYINNVFKSKSKILQMPSNPKTPDLDTSKQQEKPRLL